MSNRGYSGEVRQTRRKSSLHARRFLLGKLFHFSKYFRAKWKLKCELYRDFPLFYLRHFSPATICPSRQTHQNNALLNLKHAKFCIYLDRCFFFFFIYLNFLKYFFLCNTYISIYYIYYNAITPVKLNYS